MLCVGLDVHPSLLPEGLPQNAAGVFAFNQAIIDATLPYAVSYKVNSAFYEAFGLEGWKAMQHTLHYLKDKDVFIIADAKRGDIGNTSTQYAKAFFESLDAHAITVAPYMGSDSVKPFLQFEDKWAIVLALTSNQGSLDFQMQKLENGHYLFEEVILRNMEWGSAENLMFVVGATQTPFFLKIRNLAPNHFLLVPGIGAQGGNLEETLLAGMNNDGGLLINASRSILFASKGNDLADAAAQEAKQIQQSMEKVMRQKMLI